MCGRRRLLPKHEEKFLCHIKWDNIGYNSLMWWVVVDGGFMWGHPSTNHNSPYGRVMANVGVQHRLEFSSFVIHGLIRLSRWSGKETSSFLYNSLKCCKNLLRILLDLVTQFPFSLLTTSIWLCLLWIMVERWKNFEFLSPSFNLNSLDFCRHKISLLRSHSIA